MRSSRTLPQRARCKLANHDPGGGGSSARRGKSRIMRIEIDRGFVTWSIAVGMRHVKREMPSRPAPALRDRVPPCRCFGLSQPVVAYHCSATVYTVVKREKKKKPLHAVVLARHRLYRRHAQSAMPPTNRCLWGESREKEGGGWGVKDSCAERGQKLRGRVETGIG